MIDVNVPVPLIVVPGGSFEQFSDLISKVTGIVSIVRVVFFACDYEGDLIETVEATPIWFEMDAIPYDEMWADDRYWLPRALQGERFAGRFEFEGDTMLSKDVRWDGE